LHSAFANEILATDQKTGAIPCEIFQRIPHPNPFIIFSEPIPFPTSNSQALLTTPEIVGVLITGLTKTGYHCSTHDPQLHQINIALIGRLHYKKRPEPIYEELIIRFLITGTTSIDECMTTLQEDNPQLEDPDQFRRGYLLAINLLFYLCNTNLDLRPHTASTRKSQRKNSKSVPQMYDLGYAIGPKLFAAQRTSEPQKPLVLDELPCAPTSAGLTGAPIGLAPRAISDPNYDGFIQFLLTLTKKPQYNL
jgi:hypothetical protein